LNSNDIFQQPESPASEVVLETFDDDAYVSVCDQLDGSDILASLLAKAAVALNTDRRVAQKCIRRAAELLGVDLSRGGNATVEHLHVQSGGLAPWQARRLACYIEEKLDATIRARDLASLVRLSTSYFFRAFRKTFGDTPGAYIMRRRMLRAQDLMLKSRVSLSQVALECGMCDQAHFSRTFRRIVGTNPTVWRRQSLGRPAFGGDTSQGRQRAAPNETSPALTVRSMSTPTE
jgi:AraC family transcriptional regulator